MNIDNLPTLSLPVERTGYGAQFGSPVVKTVLEGGAPRFRADSVGIVSIVNVQWSTDPAGYDYLTAFYRTATNRGALPFKIKLILDDSDPIYYGCYFEPDTFKLTQQQGMSYIVGATLNVMPNGDSTDDDIALIGGYQDQIVDDIS